MKKLLWMGLLLLFSGTITGVATAEGNTLTFDLPGYIIGAYPIGYSTAISDHQTIDFGYTYYSTNNFFNLYNDRHGRQSGYVVNVGITNYFHDGYEGLYWAYNLGYADVNNSSPNVKDLEWPRGVSYGGVGSIGYTKIFNNGFTLDFDIRCGFYAGKHERMKMPPGFDITTGYSW